MRISKTILMAFGVVALSSCSGKKKAAVTATPAPVASEDGTAAAAPNASLIESDAHAYLEALRKSQGEASESASCTKENVLGSSAGGSPVTLIPVLRARLKSIRLVDDMLLLPWRTACETAIQAAIVDAQASAQ